MVRPYKNERITKTFTKSKGKQNSTLFTNYKGRDVFQKVGISFKITDQLTVENKMEEPKHDMRVSHLGFLANLSLKLTLLF